MYEKLPHYILRGHFLALLLFLLRILLVELINARDKYKVDIAVDETFLHDYKHLKRHYKRLGKMPLQLRV